MSLRRYIIIAMLIAMATVLSVLESFIPVFVPGVKLGLANVIILIMLYEFKIKEAFIADLLRILIASLLRANIFTPTFLMSLSGGMLSFIVMALFSRIKALSPIGVSALGGISHSTGQIIVAIIIMGTSSVVLYLPYIALLSLITGVFGGIITNVYLKRSITSKYLK
jgi:heptaprenyl diphosphate synthase